MDGDRRAGVDEANRLHSLLGVHRHEEAEHPRAAEVEDRDVDVGVAAGDLGKVVDEEGVAADSNVETSVLIR